MENILDAVKMCAGVLLAMMAVFAMLAWFDGLSVCVGTLEKVMYQDRLLHVLEGWR